MGRDDAKRVVDLRPHVDHNRYIEGGDREVVQGAMVYVWPAMRDTSSTIVWPGSDKQVYDRVMSSKDSSRSGRRCRHHKRKFPTYVRGARRIPVPAGGMLLWSSRTTHQGYPSGPRSALPVSMKPKSVREHCAHMRKKEPCKNGMLSTHWASLALNHPFGAPVAK